MEPDITDNNAALSKTIRDILGIVIPRSRN